MSISGVGQADYYQSQTTPGQAPAQEEHKALADALREQEESQPTLVEMMQEAREKAAEREKMFKLPTNSQRYGDAAIMAYSKLARARSAGEVDAASGYARRQIAQFRAAKRSDRDNADRIQAAINQLQKAVNRAGRKKRELTQEKITAKRQAKLEREKQTRKAKRLRQQLRSRQTMRTYRESGYLREAHLDNQLQDQLSAAKLELREQMQELSASVRTSVDTAVQQYTAAAASESSAGGETGGEISVQA